MEIRKNIRNKYWAFCIITVGICFFLGYFLLASLDKITHPSVQELYNSIYTVYTEFGMLIFPVLVLQTFSSDYKNKNILFYKLLGYDWLRYFLGKLLVNFVFISVPTIIGLIVVSAIYMDFCYLAVMIFYFESVICFQILLECLWGFLFRNMMVGYMANFAYWLFSIVFATANPRLSFFARYDAANIVYERLGQYFNSSNTAYLDIGGNIFYTVIVFVVIIGITYLFRKRWEKNGI